MTLPRDEMLGIARHEREALGRTIQYTPPEAWESKSVLPGWRNRDIVSHLAASEVVAAAVLVAETSAELEEYLKSDEARPPTLNGFNNFAVSRRADHPFRQVVVEWGSAADLFLARASRVTPEDWTGRRIPWVTGDIPVRYLVQARVAEWWMHGEDIRAGGELEPRREHWPIFALNGLAPREKPAPNRPADASIGGRAHSFAMVAARRVPADRLLDDGYLVVAGDEELARTILRNLRVLSRGQVGKTGKPREAGL